MIVPEGLKLRQNGRTLPAWAVPMLHGTFTVGQIVRECRDMMVAFRDGAQTWKGWKFVVGPK